jgi:integrase
VPRKFTEKYLRELKPQKAKDYLIFDSETHGLAVRVARNGGIWLLYQKRQLDGRGYRRSLGKWPALPLAKARKIVEQLAGEQAGGVNLHEKHPSRRTRRAARAGALTFGDLLELFISDKEEEGARLNYLRPLERRVRHRCKSLLPRPVESISLEELEAIWESIEGKPAVKRILPVELRTVFRWSLRKRRIAHNPMAGAFLPKAPDPRDRYLNDEQMRTVFAAAEKLGTPRKQYVQLLMMLLVRRAELARARWGEFSKDLSEWVIPRERMKGGKFSHFVPVPFVAREILKSLPRHVGCDWVFTFDGAHASVDSHTKDRLKDALSEESLPGFTLHDFRRSGRTWMDRHGVDEVTGEMLLAHKARGRIAGTYNLHMREAERRAALELFAGFLTGGVSEPILVQEPLKQLSGAGSTSAQGPPNGEIYEPQKQSWLLEPNPMIRRPSAVVRAEARADLLEEILSDPGVIAANLGLLRRKDASSAFKAAYPDYSLRMMSRLFARALADFIVLFGAPSFSLPEVSALCRAWTTVRDHHRVHAQQKRSDAELLRDQGLKDLALKREFEARKSEDSATLADSLLAIFLDSKLPPPVFRYRKQDARHHPATMARAAQDYLQRIAEWGLTKPAPTIVSAYASVIALVSRDQNRRSRRLTLVRPEPIIELPAD